MDGYVYSHSEKPITFQFAQGAYNIIILVCLTILHFASPIVMFPPWSSIFKINKIFKLDSDSQYGLQNNDLSILIPGSANPYFPVGTDKPFPILL